MRQHLFFPVIVAIIVFAVPTRVGDPGLLGIVLKQQATALLYELIQIETIRSTATIRSTGIAIGNE